MITPGWLALVLVERPSLLLLASGAVVAAYVATLAMQQVTILYGKRLFATVVLLALFFQTTSFLAFALQGGALEHATLGLVVPGLIAYQLLRQPVKATLVATAAVTAFTFSLVLIFAKLNLISGQQAGRLDIGAVFDEYALEVLLAGGRVRRGMVPAQNALRDDLRGSLRRAGRGRRARGCPGGAAAHPHADQRRPERRRDVGARGGCSGGPTAAGHGPARARRAEAAYRRRGLPKRALLVGFARSSRPGRRPRERRSEAPSQPFQ